jgi:hypothetical protein
VHPCQQRINDRNRAYLPQGRLRAVESPAVDTFLNTVRAA